MKATASTVEYLPVLVTNEAKECVYVCVCARARVSGCVFVCVRPAGLLKIQAHTGTHAHERARAGPEPFGADQTLSGLGEHTGSVEVRMLHHHHLGPGHAQRLCALQCHSVSQEETFCNF